MKASSRVVWVALLLFLLDTRQHIHRRHISAGVRYHNQEVGPVWGAAQQKSIWKKNTLTNSCICIIRTPGWTQTHTESDATTLDDVTSWPEVFDKVEISFQKRIDQYEDKKCRPPNTSLSLQGKLTKKKKMYTCWYDSTRPARPKDSLPAYYMHLVSFSLRCHPAQGSILLCRKYENIVVFPHIGRKPYRHTDKSRI